MDDDYHHHQQQQQQQHHYQHHHQQQQHTSIIPNPNPLHHTSPVFSMLDQDLLHIPIHTHYPFYHDTNHSPPPPPLLYHNLTHIHSNGVKEEQEILPNPDSVVDKTEIDTDTNSLKSEEVEHTSSPPPPLSNHDDGKGRNANGKLKSKSSSTRSAGKQKKAVAHKRMICVPASTVHDNNKYATVECLHSDSWAWRKYGQKPIKGSPFPRAYYRCSSSKGCTARKQVERSKLDPSMLVITYSSDHNHALPTPKGLTKYAKKLNTSCPTDSTPLSMSPHTDPIKSPDNSSLTLHHDDSPPHVVSSSSYTPCAPTPIPSSPTRFLPSLQLSNTQDASFIMDPNCLSLRDQDEEYNAILNEFFVATKTSSDHSDVVSTLDHSPLNVDPFNLSRYTCDYYFFES